MTTATQNALRADAERAANRRKCGDPDPWVSRKTGERGPSPDYFPESVGVYGFDYKPRKVVAA